MIKEEAGLYPVGLTCALTEKEGSGLMILYEKNE
jgi:hypothetical protein